MPNESYQKINWGWLNDYNGYKFAPITFFEQLYTEDGYSFATKYQTDWNKLTEEGSIVVKKAKQLVDDNNNAYNIGSSSNPIYFENGIPAICNNLTLNNGTITGKEINGTTINGNTINGNTIQATEKFIGNLEGNAATASKLATTQTIELIGSVVGSNSFDGSGKLTIVTTTNHNHDELYLPKNPASIELFPNSNAEHGGYIDFHYNGITEDRTSRIICGDNVLQLETFATDKTSGDKTGAIIFDTSSTMAKGDFYIQIPHLIKGSKHNYSKSIIFLDSNLVEDNSNRIGRIKSGIDQENSNDYGYIKLYAFKPVASSVTNAELYLHCYQDGSSEAGVTGETVFMGAAWNDYAEFRDQISNIKPGYCVASRDDGKIYKTTEKFQSCDGIVSDTYGFAIGKTETYQTPLAVSGRVLAYYEGDRYDYHAGDTVCAGPEGKVCKMTREEIKEYPDRIIGIVSEIPEYEEWNGKKVNNRIWIKVK